MQELESDMVNVSNQVNLTEYGMEKYEQRLKSVTEVRINGNTGNREN